MFINLKIDNVDRLPDGGPVSYRSHGRSFEIGREGRDWRLPDPDKFISGRHCEVRYEGGAFWLYDVSRNGTYVNGASQRIASPYRLGDGDRLRIGRYLLSVEIADDRGFAAVPAGPSVRPLPSANGRMAQGEAFFQPRQEARPRPPAEFAQRPVAQAGSGRSLDASDIFRAVAAGAGVPADIFLQRDPHEVAGEIGAVLRIVVEELGALLKARAAAKALAKTTERTMVGATDNNPLKFVPAAPEALDILFSRRRSGYLDARQSVEEAFRDLKAHEIATYAAMQAALARLLDELSPETIERKLPPASFTSKKGRAWDALVATWEAKENAHENGLLDIFLAHFSEAYAKAAKPK
jgi:type VI secretion system protein ImpI